MPAKSSKPTSAREKLRAYFIEHVGEVIDSKTLQDVAGISEWARRVRELRLEYGMDILTHNDRDDLRPNEYILRSTDVRDAYVRGISKETRAFVLDRDGNTCQSCGSAAGEPSVYDPSQITRLQMGHIKDKSHGGTDEADNLRALCSFCNEGAANVSLPRPSYIQLLSQVRRAPRTDQQSLLKWLLEKYDSSE